MFTSGLSHTDFDNDLGSPARVTRALVAALPLENVIHDSGTLHKYFSSPGQPAFTAHIGTPFSSFGSSVVEGAAVVTISFIGSTFTLDQYRPAPAYAQKPTYHPVVLVYLFVVVYTASPIVKVTCPSIVSILQSFAFARVIFCVPSAFLQ